MTATEAHGSPRVVLVDDAPLFRAGVAALLAEQDIAVVAQLADASALRDAVDRHEADVAVLDVRMPPTFTTEGLEAARELRRVRPRVGVLVLSQYVETRHAVALLEGSGAGVGYLLKERVSDAPRAGGRQGAPEAVAGQQRWVQPPGQFAQLDVEGAGLVVERRDQPRVGRGSVEREVRDAVVGARAQEGLVGAAPVSGGRAVLADPLDPRGGGAPLAVPVVGGPTIREALQARTLRSGSPNAVVRDLDLEPRAAATLVAGTTTFFDYLVDQLRYEVSSVAADIACPTLLTHGHDDRIADVAPRLRDALRVPVELVPFTADEGAGDHCEMRARSLYHQRVFDWLDETLGHRS